jgi:glycosyltransferase involved in cell wall biosynthesis
MAGGVVYLVPDWPWPATTGSRLRPASINQALQPFGPVTLLAADRADSRFPGWSLVVADLSRRRTLREKLLDHGKANLRGRGLVLQRAIQDGLHHQFAGVIDEVRPSLVVLTPPFLGPFIDAARRGGAFVVANADESLARSYRSIAWSRYLPVGRRVRAALDSVAFRRLERREYRRVDQVWSSNEIDASVFARIAGRDRVRFVPNTSPAPVLPEPCGTGVHSIAFVGSFGHPPNQAAAAELLSRIMPAVRDAGGPHRLVLIGRDPTPDLLGMAARDADTQVTDTVDDVSIHLCAAGVLVVPLRSGAGTRIKILEAAALGVPVVSTRFGAEGLDFRDGVELLLAETPAEFAQCVKRLVDDESLRRDLTRAAQEAVRRRFSQSSVDAAVDVALRPLIEQRAGAGE